MKRIKMRFNDYKIPPLKSWKKFQEMVCELFSEVWKDPHTQEFGREGQRQNGIDILGTRRSTGDREGVQATLESPLSAKKIKGDYEKSKELGFDLDCFIVATSSPRDTKIQKVALSLSKDGPYKCVVWFWEDILDCLSDYNDIRRKYYPDWVIFKTVGDSSRKLVEINDDTTRFVIMITKLPEDHPYYRGLLLISDLLNCICQTYKIGDHWTRLILEGIADAGYQKCVGGNKHGAYLLSKWLNTFESADEILNSQKLHFAFRLTSNEKEEFREMMRELRED